MITRPRFYSFTRDNYTLDNVGCPCKWRWRRDSSIFPFPFEQNEGFDTDNDMEGDFAEINSSIPNATGGSDPIDSRDPIRNRAVLLNAANSDFLRVHDASVNNVPNYLERFTVEAWVLPTGGLYTNQTVIERSMQLPHTDWLGRPLTHANFRLGLTTNNTPYAMYNGKGALASYFAVAPYSYRVATNVWTHLAATYDGSNLTLYVNGQVARPTKSTDIPATGMDIALAQRELVTSIIGAREPDSLIPLFQDGVLPWRDNEQGVRYSTAGYGLYALAMQPQRPIKVNASEFFNGYIDEVRVWNGVRGSHDIKESMTRKLARTAGTTSVTLENYYGFDDCPDVDIHWTNSAGQAIASQPRIPYNIEALQGPGLPMNRTVYEWDLMPQKSTVYYGSTNVASSSNRWNYIVFAEDYALHNASIPPRDDFYHPARDTNGVFTGELPLAYRNPANPYEERINQTRWAWERPIRDLLFFNGARADGDVFVSVDSWLAGMGDDPDQQDADGDGLPDNWETVHGLNPNDATGVNGANGDPDGDGLTNIFEYQAGLDPNSPDTNGDGISDADEDLDADGLVNRTEQNLGTLPLKADTDDDGLTDGEEYTGTDNIGGTVTPQAPIGTSDSINSLDPLIRRAMSFNGAGRVIIPPQDKFMTDSWTIEMWVNPDAAGDGGVLISRYVKDLVSAASGINYEMGLAPAGTGFMRPYVRYVTRDGTVIRLDGTGGSDVLPPGVPCDCVIPVGEWSHLAGVYSVTNSRLELYIDGKLRAYRLDATPVPPQSFGLNAIHRGDEVTLGAARSTVAISSDGYEGLLDEFKFYNTAKSAEDIELNYNTPPSGNGGSAPYAIPYRNRLYMPEEGMASELAGLPSDRTVNAVVQLWAVPAEDTVQTLEDRGLQVLYRVGSRGFAVRGTKAQIDGLGNMIRWSGLVAAQDKISPAIGSRGGQTGRWVLAHFFVGTSQSNALAAVQTAGANAYGNKYLAGTYMLAEADDTQVQALAADNSVAWIGKATTNLMTGARLIDDDEGAGLSPAPFTTPSQGWDGPGLGSADLGYFFYNGTDKIPGDSENDAIVEQMMKWAKYAAITWSPVSFEQGFSSDIFWCIG